MTQIELRTRTGRIYPTVNGNLGVSTPGGRQLREADFTGVLHPQFEQWLDEIRQESTDSLENDALADAILQKSEENQGKIELKS